MKKNKSYKYKAVNEKGRIVRGVMNAQNDIDLHRRLDSAGYQLLAASVIKPSFGDRFFVKRTMSLREKIQIYKSLEQILSAGIPVLNGLELCANSTTKTATRDILTSLRQMVADGLPMSKAMYQHKEIFSRIECTIVRSNEETGDLVKSFQYLHAYMERNDSLRRRIKKATMYPMILLGVIILAIVIMMGVVVPQILGLVYVLRGTKELPFATTSLMATSGFFEVYWIHVLAGIVLSVVAFKLLREKSGGFRHKVDEWMLRVPLFGSLIRKLEIARFCATFSSLYDAGIQFTQALKVSSRVVNNAYLREAVETAAEDVSKGTKFSDALAATGQFPPIVTQMLTISEESGNVSQIMRQVVSFYENDVDDSIDAMVTSIEPALTAVLALVIVWIAAAVFGPIYSSIGDLNF